MSATVCPMLCNTIQSHDIGNVRQTGTDQVRSSNSVIDTTAVRTTTELYTPLRACHCNWHLLPCLQHRRPDRTGKSTSKPAADHTSARYSSLGPKKVLYFLCTVWHSIRMLDSGCSRTRFASKRHFQTLPGTCNKAWCHSQSSSRGKSMDYSYRTAANPWSSSRHNSKTIPPDWPQILAMWERAPEHLRFPIASELLPQHRPMHRSFAYHPFLKEP